MPLEFKPVTCNPQLEELGIHSNQYRLDFESISRDLRALQPEDVEYLKIVKTFSASDFFFFCYFVLDLPVNHPFLVARIYEIQDNSNLTLDLWFREGWKSTLLTFALSIQEVIKNPEERIVIFSHTRDMAKSHMRKIKIELEQNKILWNAFPDIFYANPDNKSPKWSENDGLYCKRKKNYGEATFEAWGLIDKLPAGKHFTKRIYDDIITEKAIMTIGQLDKVERQFALSEALKTQKGGKRIVGTRYSHKDLYGKLINKRWITRLYPAEVDEEGEGKRHGIPVYKTADELDIMYDAMGEYLYNCQMLQNPTAESMQKFRLHWLRTWSLDTKKPFFNVYIVVDPAMVVAEKTDYTSMMVIGVDYMRNYWILDIVRDKLELGERWTKLRDLVLQWQPMSVGYEKLGGGAVDIQYIKMQQEKEGIHFHIIELASFGSKAGHSTARINSLMPLFEKGRIIIPDALPQTKDGVFRDIIHEFVQDEYLKFPYPEHDDMLDALGHILTPEMEIFFPTRKDGDHVKKEKNYDDPLDLNNEDEETGSWMSY